MIDDFGIAKDNMPGAGLRQENDNSPMLGKHTPSIYALHKKLASKGQTTLGKFIAERKTLQFSVFLILSLCVK